MATPLTPPRKVSLSDYLNRRQSVGNGIVGNGNIVEGSSGPSASSSSSPHAPLHASLPRSRSVGAEGTQSDRPKPSHQTHGVKRRPSTHRPVQEHRYRGSTSSQGSHGSKSSKGSKSNSGEYRGISRNPLPSPSAPRDTAPARRPSQCSCQAQHTPLCPSSASSAASSSSFDHERYLSKHPRPMPPSGLPHCHFCSLHPTHEDPLSSSVSCCRSCFCSYCDSQYSQSTQNRSRSSTSTMSSLSNTGSNSSCSHYGSGMSSNLSSSCSFCSGSLPLSQASTIKMGCNTGHYHHHQHRRNSHHSQGRSFNDGNSICCCGGAEDAHSSSASFGSSNISCQSSNFSSGILKQPPPIDKNLSNVMGSANSKTAAKISNHAKSNSLDEDFIRQGIHDMSSLIAIYLAGTLSLLVGIILIVVMPVFKLLKAVFLDGLLYILFTCFGFYFGYPTSSYAQSSSHIPSFLGSDSSQSIASSVLPTTIASSIEDSDIANDMKSLWNTYLELRRKRHAGGFHLNSNVAVNRASENVESSVSSNHDATSSYCSEAPTNTIDNQASATPNPLFTHHHDAEKHMQPTRFSQVQSNSTSTFPVSPLPLMHEKASAPPNQPDPTSTNDAHNETVDIDGIKVIFDSNGVPLYNRLNPYYQKRFRQQLLQKQQLQMMSKQASSNFPNSKRGGLTKHFSDNHRSTNQLHHL
ncbi:hypothetical protein ACHAXS_002849 [Conticribra weissflogii]